MKTTYAMILALTLGAPAAAESGAPGLPFIDAAVVRTQPFEKESIEIGAAKGLFDGPVVTKVENPDYICQGSGGGYAIRSAGRSSRIWQLDGLASGAAEGLELNKVFIDRSGLPGRLSAEGFLSFPGQELKVELDLRRNPGNGGGMAMTVKVGGEATPLKNVPCAETGAGKDRAAAGWQDYDTNNFPNGSVIWNLSECAQNYKNRPYLGCYASPELTINRKEPNKPAVKLKGMIVSKIMPNENAHDSGGYGYCLKDKHHYRIVHEVRVMEKGRAVAYLYPEFYAGGFKPSAAQSLYEWGGGMWGTANCDKTDKSLVFTAENAYTLSSPAAALDFGNIVFTLDADKLTFVKL